MKSFSVLGLLLLSGGAQAFDASVIEHREKLGSVGFDEDEKLLNLSPGLTLSEFGISHDVAVNKSFDLDGGNAGTVEIKIEFNSSGATDDESGILKRLSIGGGDSLFRVQYLSNTGNLYYGAGADISGWEYNLQIETEDIVNEDSVIGNYNLYVNYRIDEDFYLGAKASYYDVLSDNEENLIESEINGDNTFNIRGLIPFRSDDGSTVWLQADLIFPLAGEDPIFTLGAVMNFNVL